MIMRVPFLAVRRDHNAGIDTCIASIDDQAYSSLFTLDGIIISSSTRRQDSAFILVLAAASAPNDFREASYQIHIWCSFLLGPHLGNLQRNPSLPSPSNFFNLSH